MQRSDDRRWDEVVPPAFVMSAAITVVAGLVFAVLFAYGFDELRSSRGTIDGWLPELIRYGRPLLSPGFGLAAAALLAIGFAELARRAGPGIDGGFLRTGMAAALVMLGCVLAAVYVRYWYALRAPGDAAALHRTIQELWIWQQRVWAAAALVASGALVLAGRRLHVVRGLAIPLFLATAFAFPFEMVWELIHQRDPSQGDLWTSVFLDIGIDVAFAGTLLAVASAIGRHLPPPAVDLARAGNGLQRVGSALIARVLLVVVAAFTAVTTFASHSMGLLRLKAALFPLGFLIAGIALVTGMLQAGSISTPNAPRKRLYAAATFTAAALVAETIKALLVYHSLAPRNAEGHGSRFELEQMAVALPYATPALALAGLLCLLWGLAAMRDQLAAARVERSSIAGAAITVSVFTVAAVLTLRWGRSEPGDLGAFVLVSILVAIFSVIAQLAVARASHRVAEAMREAPALPTAVVAPNR